MLKLTISFSHMTSLSDPGIIPRYPTFQAINNGEIPDKFSKPKIDGEDNIITDERSSEEHDASGDQRDHRIALIEIDESKYLITTARILIIELENVIINILLGFLHF